MSQPLCHVFGVRHLSPAAAHHLHAVLTEVRPKRPGGGAARRGHQGGRARRGRLGQYLESVMKKRGADWRGLYNACKELT